MSWESRLQKMQNSCHRISRLGARWGGFLLIGVAVIAWAVASASGVLPNYLFPNPKSFVVTLIHFLTGLGPIPGHRGNLWPDLAVSGLRVLLGFGIAGVTGIAVGLLCGRFEVLAGFLDLPIQLVRSVPGISWLPIAMVWFGIGTPTTVFLIALAAFFPVYINTFHGVRHVPTHWVRAAEMLGANRRQVLLKVILPGAWPSIESGLRVSLGVSWAYVVLGELTGARRGLGALIMDARMMGDIPTVLVGMVCIAAAGRMSDFFLQAVLRRIYGHRRPHAT